MKETNNLQELMKKYSLPRGLVAKFLKCDHQAITNMKCGNQKFTSRDETVLLLKLKSHYEKNLESLKNDLDSIIEK